MKKWIALLLAVAVCASLAACGGTGNPDHDYVLALMEKGDYDMAIKVLENLRGETEIAAESEIATEAQADTAATEAVKPASNLSSVEQLVVDTVNQFMVDKGNDLSQAFKDIIAEDPRPLTVTHAMEYRLGNCDGNGNVAHCLLIYLSGDIAGDWGADDKLQLLLDMDTQKLYNSVDVDFDLISTWDGMPTNKEEFNITALGCYRTFVEDNTQWLMSDSAIYEPLTEDALAAINEALNQ